MRATTEDFSDVSRTVTADFEILAEADAESAAERPAASNSTPFATFAVDRYLPSGACLRRV